MHETTKAQKNQLTAQGSWLVNREPGLAPKAKTARLPPHLKLTDLIPGSCVSNSYSSPHSPFRRTDSILLGVPRHHLKSLSYQAFVLSFGAWV